MKELFEFLGLTLPFRAKVMIVGAASVFMGGWTLTLHHLIPELWWTGVVLVVAGVILLSISFRALLSTQASNKSRSTARRIEDGPRAAAQGHSTDSGKEPA